MTCFLVECILSVIACWLAGWLAGVFVIAVRVVFVFSCVYFVIFRSCVCCFVCLLGDSMWHYGGMSIGSRRRRF